MAITDPTQEIQAFVTDQARQFIAKATVGGVVYRYVGFSVGRGGFDPSNPIEIVPIDTSLPALLDQVYPDITGTSDFQSIDAPYLSTQVLSCRLPNTLSPSNADYALGEIGIWAQIIQSNDVLEVGTNFLFAVAHFPIRAKTRKDAWLFRVTIQF